MKKNNNRQRKTGFARTEKVPHEGHPAFFKKKNKDDIEYVTFTHTVNPKFNGKIHKTEELKCNINPLEEGIKKSNVIKKVYVGKRSALGEGTREFRLHNKDRDLIEKIFNTAPKEIVNYKKKDNKKRKNPENNSGY